MSPDDEFQLLEDLAFLKEERAKDREWRNMVESILEGVPGATAELRRLRMAQEIKEFRDG